jgi:hypothetical protein
MQWLPVRKKKIGWLCQSDCRMNQRDGYGPRDVDGSGPEKEAFKERYTKIRTVIVNQLSNRGSRSTRDCSCRMCDEGQWQAEEEIQSHKVLSLEARAGKT